MQREPTSRLPATFRFCGIAGRPVNGKAFPRYTARLFGTLTITETEFRWTVLIPWRHPRVVEVMWSDVTRIEMGRWASGGYVIAKGWRVLLLAPSQSQRFRDAITAVGFVIHRSPAWPDRSQALWPGVEPDWVDRGGPLE